MTLLNEAQAKALEAVATLRSAAEAELEALEAQIRTLRETRKREILADAHAAVRRAHASGVPKSQIGRAYGTKDPGTINKILEG